MKMKKIYHAPRVRSEQFKIGVYGDYGTTGDDDTTWNPIQILNPLFAYCCS